MTIKHALAASALTPALLMSVPALATPPTPTVLVGIHPNADGNCDSNVDTDASYCEANIQARETQIGRTFAIDSQYIHFDFTTVPEAEWTVTYGRMPMFTWQHGFGTNGCIFWHDVVDGDYDTQLATQAHYFAGLGASGGGSGRPILIRFLPEMNKPHEACLYDVNPVTDPVDAGVEFQALWQHVYNVVHPIAPNVQWDFSPGLDAFNNGGTPVNTWADFYPGDGYVDWIGTEDYHSSAIVAQSIQDDPGTNNWYDQASLRGKPLVLSETGAVDNSTVSPDPQQRWYYSMSANFAASYPMIHALVVFDVNAQGGDYRLAGNGETGFANMAAKTYFSKTPW